VTHVYFVRVSEEGNGKWHLRALLIRLLGRRGSQALIGKLRARVTNRLLTLRLLVLVLIIVTTYFEPVMICLNYCLRQ